MYKIKCICCLSLIAAQAIGQRFLYPLIIGQRALPRQLGCGYWYRFLKIIKYSQMIADWQDMSKLLCFTVGLSKRCCQSCVITHFNSMSINKVSVSRLPSEKSASIFYLTAETSIEQTVSQVSRKRIVFVGRVLKTARKVMTECIQRNLPYCISA